MYPKEHFIGIYSPGRSLVQFIVELKNIPGALAKASMKVAESNVNILTGFHIIDAQGDICHWSFFADFTDILMEPGELAGNLEKLDIVTHVDFTDRVENLIIDRFHFPFLAFGEESLIFNTWILVSIFTDLYKTFGSGGAFIIYQMGERAGKDDAAYVMGRYRLEGLKALQTLLMERMAMGWCIAEVEKYDKNRMEVTVKAQELFECKPFKDRLKRVRSQFFRGYLRGSLTELLDPNIKATETMCIARGDPYCLFEAKASPP